MKASSDDALREALALLQETAQSPFLAEDTKEARSQMADLDELFLLNMKMRRQNLDRWIQLLTREVERRAEAVRVRRVRRERDAEARMRISA